MLVCKLSNIMDIDFSLEVLQNVMTLPGKLEIFIAYQGSQITSQRFTGILTSAGIKVSMDGKVI
ncbi:hypothetical protein GCM10011317_52740 [Niveispirillum cyanobacteriorum]|nr:hypothetical protein GCM10011317_52740 [Niveispirillum cyanobacteriorum]